MANIRIDNVGTKAIRSKMSQSKKIKITINLDADILSLIRELAEETGVPYQKLVNRTLREHFTKRIDEESRLDALEREVKALKRKLSA